MALRWQKSDLDVWFCVLEFNKPSVLTLRQCSRVMSENTVKEDNTYQVSCLIQIVHVSLPEFGGVRVSSEPKLFIRLKHNKS